jgi:hypothetical protein
MAKLWITYREGLRLLGAVVAEVPLEPTVARLDLAPWRLFSIDPPETVPVQQVEQATERKRALVEVTPTDRYDLCGLVVGFFESPYSAQECLRRLDLGSAIAASA